MTYTANDLTRTIYSIGWHESVKALEEYRKCDMSSYFNETWTKKQDNLHLPYLDKWKTANKENISLAQELSYGYPTNGSSEAIFMQLTYLNSQGKRLVVFEEEYEGYSMFAKNISMPILTLSRENIKWDLISPENDIFFISQPSSIDGNIWDGYNNFIQQTNQRHIKVYVDLAYIGLFKHEKIDLTSSNIEGIFFSLSKVFGVYYHRIGGCFLRKENPLLWPMLWFKNLNSIGYGQVMLEKQINGQYENTFNEIKKIQIDICKKLSQDLNMEVTPSDVPMIASVVNSEDIDWIKAMRRGNSSSRVRICISKILEEELKIRRLT